LPHTPPTASGPVSARQILGLDALVMFKDKSYLTFMVASALICIPLAFYYQITSRVVEMTGLPIGQTMSYGQMSEIFFMVVMPLFFARLGVKWMLAVGMLAWVVRYVLFATGAPDDIRWMIIAGVLLHGICYDFFFVTGQIYTDQVAPRQVRAQAQGLLVMLTLGLGMFLGAQVAGHIETQHTPDRSRQFADQVVAKTAERTQAEAKLAAAPAAEKAALDAQVKALDTEVVSLRRQELKAIEWKPLWMKPALFAAAVLLVFLMVFRNPTRASRGA
jgi:Nucleoside H+ symporter